MVTRQQQLERTRRVMPGGVNSSTRLNRAIGTPFFASRAEGSHVWDIEGRRFIDMNCGHGCALLGHGHRAVAAALSKASELGHLDAFETEHHEQLASLICRLVPCADRVLFCSSGSEATLHLIRACRGFTGRQKILRVEGHFHGYHEMIYIGGFPPAGELERNRTRPYIESPGIPAVLAVLVIPIPHNDPQALEDDGVRAAFEGRATVCASARTFSANIPSAICTWIFSKRTGSSERPRR